MSVFAFRSFLQQQIKSVDKTSQITMDEKKKKGCPRPLSKTSKGQRSGLFSVLFLQPYEKAASIIAPIAQLVFLQELKGTSLT